MLRYIYNIFNIPNMTLNYIEDKFINFYNSLLIQPEEEIEMKKLDFNNIITTQPKLKTNYN
jgi:hypothetical protein